jgi:hypothetical protein
MESVVSDETTFSFSPFFVTAEMPVLSYLNVKFAFPLSPVSTVCSLVMERLGLQKVNRGMARTNSYSEIAIVAPATGLRASSSTVTAT